VALPHIPFIILARAAPARRPGPGQSFLAIAKRLLSPARPPTRLPIHRGWPSETPQTRALP
jgi:hypothetical protein